MHDPGTLSWRPLATAATVLGIGMGGALDGIILHEMLQLHHQVSAIVPPRASVVNAEINMFWDGVFQLGCWITTAIGLALLWRASLRPGVGWSTKILTGGLLLGWGLFNLVEGIIDHHLLHLHHVIEQPGHLVYDLAYLATGVILAAAGLLILRGGSRNPAARVG